MPRSAERFAGFHAGDQFVPVGHFPLDTCVFPADEAAVSELDAAVGEALAEVRIATPAEIEARRARTREIIEEFPDASEELLRAARQPFAVPRLRRFLAGRRPAFEAAHAAMKCAIDRPALDAIASAVDQPVAAVAAALGAVERHGGFEIGAMVRATLTLLVERVHFLREIGAPDVILEDARQAARRVLDPGWRLVANVDDLVPDRVHIATVVDGPGPLEVDLMPVLLLAVQCCVEPSASSIEDARLSGLAWSPFGGGAEAPDPGPLPGGSVAVVPALHDAEGTLDGLDFALVAAGSPLRSLAPGGAVVRVAMSEPEDD